MIYEISEKELQKLIDNKVFILGCVLLVVVLWAMNFVFIKFVLLEFDVYTALFLRLTLVALVLLPFVKAPRLDDLLMIFLTALVLVPGHYGLLFLSLKLTTNVGVISVVMQLAIPFSILLSWFIFKDSPGKMKLTGLFIAFSGIIVLFYEPSMFDNIWALLIGTASAFFLGLYFILVKKIKHLSPFGIIAYTSLLGLPFLYILMLMNNENFSSVLGIENNITWFSLLFTVIGSSIMGHGLWAWLIKYQDISFITPFLLLVPVLAVMISSVVFNEILTFEFLLISSVIIFGIFLVFIAKKEKK